MNLVTLPFLPITALVKLAQVLQDEAQRDLQAAARRQLEEAEYARASGQAADEEIARLEEQAVRRLIDGRPPAARGDRSW